MKHLLLIIFSFVSMHAFSQTAAVVVQEKSSDWIKVAAAGVSARPTTTVKKVSKPRAVRRKKTATKPKETEFEKTNKQVNRFKKTKDN